jgi:hypothetical protein
LQAAGADLVIGFNVPSYTALSQLQGLRLNYKPQWVYSNIGSDASLVGSLLARFSQGSVTDAGLLDGAITDSYFATVDMPDDPWTKQFDAIWKANGTGGELTNYRIFGMTQAYTFVQALQAAGPNPTREGLVAAVEKTGTSLQGPWAAPYRFSADRHAGLSGVRVTKIVGTGQQPLTGVMVTDNGDVPVTPYTAPEAIPPADGIPQQPAAG